MLGNIDLHGKEIRVIRNIYWKETACIQIESEFTEYTKIERVWSDFSMDPLNLYSRMILKGQETLRWFIIGKCNFNICNAGDTVDDRLKKKN